MDAWYNGYSAATLPSSPTPNYARTVNEYYSGSSHSTFPTTHNYLGHIVDLSSSSSTFTTNSNAQASWVNTKVCQIINNIANLPTILSHYGDGSLYVPVYVDQIR